jgi:chromosomal replication initiation ATPase DnaA
MTPSVYAMPGIDNIDRLIKTTCLVVEIDEREAFERNRKKDNSHVRQIIVWFMVRKLNEKPVNIERYFANRGHCVERSVCYHCVKVIDNELALGVAGTVDHVEKISKIIGI